MEEKSDRQYTMIVKTEIQQQHTKNTKGKKKNAHIKKNVINLLQQRFYSIQTF